MDYKFLTYSLFSMTTLEILRNVLKEARICFKVSKNRINEAVAAFVFKQLRVIWD